MPVNLKGRSFLSLMDFSAAEIRYLLDLSHDLKCKKRSGILGKSLRGKNVVLLFEKTSTRTRCASTPWESGSRRSLESPGCLLSLKNAGESCGPGSSVSSTASIVRITADASIR